MKKQADALLITPEALFVARRVQLVTLAAGMRFRRCTIGASLPTSAG
jgi:hypothetical protein